MEAIHLHLLNKIVQLNELGGVLWLVADVVGVRGDSTEDKRLDRLELDHLHAQLLRQTNQHLVLESHVFEFLVSWEVVQLFQRLQEHLLALRESLLYLV